MPNVRGVSGHLDTRFGSVVGENAELDLAGVFRVDGEVDPGAVPSRAEWMRRARK
jgi:hypothetical protein